jgi:hypothetical protein
MTTQERFASDYGMPLNAVRELVRLAEQAAECNEHAHNGDPITVTVDGKHVRVETQNWASAFWLEKLIEIDKRIRRLVKPYGFTNLAYPDFGPTLIRDKQYVEIPYEAAEPVE